MHRKSQVNDKRVVRVPRALTPPTIYTSIAGTHTIRFLNLTGSVATFTPTYNDFLDLLFVATGSTTGYRLLDAFRIRKIQVWWSASSSTASSIAYVEDINLSGTPSIGGPSRTKLNAQPSPGENGYLEYIPKKGSVQDCWYNAANTSGQNIMRLSIPVNATVDLTFMYTMADGVDNPTSVNRTVGPGCVTGQIYTSKLSNYITPQGVATI